ncbi:MAG: hypothetical protein H6809_03975 [Phycisphaeraceae bacterium]|nr:hypothetical protein [Phycisphaeraceae bacterium]
MTENRRTRSSDQAPADRPPPGVVDRRSGLDRREIEALKSALQGLPEESGDTKVSGLERRRGPGRRRSDFLRSAEEGELTREQFLFLMAIEEFKRANDRTFPSWTDVLEVVRLLGYRKTMPSELNLTSAEDWREAPATPSNVRPARWRERFGAKRGGANAEAA